MSLISWCKFFSPGRKPEEEGVEDNGLEENSGDGQVCATLLVNRFGGLACGSHVMALFCFVAGGC